MAGRRALETQVEPVSGSLNQRQTWPVSHPRVESRLFVSEPLPAGSLREKAR